MARKKKSSAPRPAKPKRGYQRQQEIQRAQIARGNVGHGGDIIKEGAKFVANAAKTAGKAAHSAVKAVDKATGEISNALGDIPVVGPAFEAAVDSTLRAPFTTTNKIMSGERLDKVALNALETQVNAVREVGPYAQMVVSMVPGVGTGIAAGIGAGVALSKGQPITKAIIEGIKGSIPGGPVAQAAFTATMALAEGQRIDQAAIAALPVPDSAKAGISLAVQFTGDIARGEKLDEDDLLELVSKLPAAAQASINVKIDEGIPLADVANIAIDEAIKSAPKTVQTAIQTGVATAVGQQLQNSAKLAAKESVDNFIKIGTEKVKKNPIIEQAAKMSPNQDAFELGIGLVTHSNVPQVAITAIRNSLKTPEQKVAFDNALAFHIGAVISKPPKLHVSVKKGKVKITVGKPPKLRTKRREPEKYKWLSKEEIAARELARTPKQSKRELELENRAKAGYYTTKGLRRHVTPEVKVAIIDRMLKSKSAKKGVAIAVKESLPKVPWYKRLLGFFGFTKES